MTIGIDYYDTMDHDRCVMPEQDLGSHFLCRVYFRDSGYAGKVKLLKKMFGDSRHGFVFKDQLGK